MKIQLSQKIVWKKQAETSEELYNRKKDGMNRLPNYYNGTRNRCK